MEEPNAPRQPSEEPLFKNLLFALEEAARNVIQNYNSTDLLGLPLPAIVNARTQSIWAESQGVSDGLDRLCAYENRLEAVEMQLSDVKRRLRLYRAQVSMSIGPPIGLLPVEVLEKIFAFSRVRDKRYPTGYGNYCTTAVTHVCYFWREIALQHGILWADIDLSWPEGKINSWATRATTAGQLLKLFGCAQEYAGHHMDVFFKKLYQLSDAIASLCRRHHLSKIGGISIILRSINWAPSRDANAAIYRYFKQVHLMPSLTSVNISLEGPDDHPLEKSRRSRPTLGLGGLPLESLTLRRAFATGFNSERLLVLELHSVSLSCEKWEDLLSSSPSLELLRLSNVSAFDFNTADSTWKPSSNPIVLGSLRTMSLRVHGVDNAFSLFLGRVLSAPHIQQLTIAEIESDCYIDKLLPLFPTVKVLRITAWAVQVPVTKFLHLISELALIEELEIILAEEEMNEDFRRCLDTLSVRSPNPVPKGKALRCLRVPQHAYAPATLQWIKERVDQFIVEGAEATVDEDEDEDDW